MTSQYLKKTCEVCGVEGGCNKNGTYESVPGYNVISEHILSYKPYKTVWVCKKCHNGFHIKEGRTLLAR